MADNVLDDGKPSTSKRSLEAVEDSIDDKPTKKQNNEPLPLSELMSAVKSNLNNLQSTSQGGDDDTEADHELDAELKAMGVTTYSDASLKDNVFKAIEKRLADDQRAEADEDEEFDEDENKVHCIELTEDDLSQDDQNAVETESPENEEEADDIEDEATTNDRDYEPDEDEEDETEPLPEEDYPEAAETPNIDVSKLNTRKRFNLSNRKVDIDKVFDDGNLKLYNRRMAKYYAHLEEEDPQYFERPVEYVTLDEEDGFRIPKKIYDKLYNYQQDSLLWFYRKHKAGKGAILADEMGLGKTIQLISYLVALRSSNLKNTERANLGPVLIICPATVLQNWVKEFHTWWPEFRVAVLHQTGTFKKDRKKLATAIFECEGVLLVTYTGLISYRKFLVDYDWHYVILDEGHRIRNNEAQMTIICKRFTTRHRLILTGTPMQNNLRELWSLMDFIHPGYLGSLESFKANVIMPISKGNYSTDRNDPTVMASYHAISSLSKRVRPFILQRTKDQVMASLQLPEKNEKVLFCNITDEQRAMYIDFIQKPGLLADVIDGKVKIFSALISLRKICNHPFLMVPTKDVKFDDQFFARSSKMDVLRAFLKAWYKNRYKVLIFSQSRQVLDLIECFCMMKHYTYLRMDGTTPVGQRQGLVDKFNESDDVFLFLLTTKVGGIGVNLTGANRVIIFDPDWNPCTDIQARERCWRIGQLRDVMIFRLLTNGTVEEKIYHRQIFKQYLTDKVLKNPGAQRMFKVNDLQDLFTLSDGVLKDCFPRFKMTKKQLLSESNKGKVRAKEVLANEAASKQLPKIPKKESPTKKASSSQNAKVEVDEKGEIIVKLSEERREQLRLAAKKLNEQFKEKFLNEKKDTTTTSEAETSIKVEAAPEAESSKSSAVAEDVEEEDKAKKKKKKKKHAKEKKKPKSGKYCDGVLVGNLKKVEDYVEKFDTESKRGQGGKNEFELMSQLLGSNHLNTILKHDEIEEVSTIDEYGLGYQAEEVAQRVVPQLCDAVRAAQSLREVRTKLMPPPPPAEQQQTTFRRLFGNVGRDGQAIKKDDETKMSSAKLIETVFGRNNADADKSKRLLVDIYEYIIAQRESASSADVVVGKRKLTEHFRNRIDDEQRFLFEVLVKKLCRFVPSKATPGGLWHLRSEFLVPS